MNPALFAIAISLLVVACGAGCSRAVPLRVEVLAPEGQYAYGEDIALRVAIRNVSRGTVRVLQPEFWPSPDDPRNSIEFNVRSESGTAFRRVGHTLTGDVHLWPSTVALGPGQSITSKVHMFSPSGGIWDEFPEKPGGFSYVRGQAGYPDYYIDHFLTNGAYSVRVTYGVGKEHKALFAKMEREARRQYQEHFGSTNRLPEHVPAPPAYRNLWYGKVASEEFTVRIKADQK